MPLEQPSEEGRRSQLSELERLQDEYLEAKRAFLRILADDTLAERGKALVKADKARKVALDLYIEAAVNAAGED